ncbi:MAG: hypothetical protein ACRDFB_09515 [Rhabdochlamydiaceae bacterium]
MNDNDRIRLIILYQYYGALFDGQRGRIDQNSELKDIPYATINANLVWLLDKGLINGQKRYADDGLVHVLSIDITASGMDIVEKILNQSLTALDQNITSEINKESTIDRKFNKLYKISVKAEPVFNILINATGMILSSLR